MLEKLLQEEKLEHHHIEAGRFNQNELQIIQNHFHNLILERAKRIDSFMALEDKNLPVITNDIFLRWYPVPGMYGGFCYWLIERNGCPILMTESWCRVCGGSGQMHIISTDGYVLVGRRTDLYPDHHEYDPNGLLPEDLDVL